MALCDLLSRFPFHGLLTFSFEQSWDEESCSYEEKALTEEWRVRIPFCHYFKIVWEAICRCFPILILWIYHLLSPQYPTRNETSSVFSKRFCYDFQAFQACREKVLEACLLSLGIAALDDSIIAQALQHFYSNNLGLKSSWPGNIMFFLLLLVHSTHSYIPIVGYVYWTLWGNYKS